MSQRQGRSRSIFEILFCCNDSSEVSAPSSKSKSSIYSFSDYLKQNPQKDKRTYQLNLFNGLYVDRLRKIKTQKVLRDIRISDTQTTNQLQYACPICFRYFNYILTSKCCDNYICHLCALEYKTMKCHFCQSEDCAYVDVNQQNETKIYSDSQGMQRFKQMSIDNS